MAPYHGLVFWLLETGSERHAGLGLSWDDRADKGNGPKCCGGESLGANALGEARHRALNANVRMRQTGKTVVTKCD